MSDTHISGPLHLKDENGTYKQLNQLDTIAKLNQTITNPPTQAEVQAISDKVDALIQKLIDAGIIKAS